MSRAAAKINVAFRAPTGNLLHCSDVEGLTARGRPPIPGGHPGLRSLACKR